MAFIDVDEFLVIRDASVESLPQLLSEYTDYGALAVNWQVTAMHSQCMYLLSWQQRLPLKNHQAVLFSPDLAM